MNPMHPSSQAGRLRIIVADDHEWIREILLQITEQTLPEAEIIAVEDGKQALDAYRAGGCDFLVTNHKMPHLDGMELIQAIRKQEPGLPILMVSIEPASKDDAIKAGANWFLTKTQIMEEMPSILRRNAGKQMDPILS